MAQSLMPYALALFEASVETGKEEQVAADLAAIDEILKKEPEYVLALAHPKITRDQKTKWLMELFEKDTDPLTSRFLAIAAQHGQAGHLKELYEDWQQCARQYHNVETVLVQTPAPLSEKDRQALQGMLENRLKRKTELKVEIVPELIAGLRVRARDLVLDNSLRSRLDAMHQQLVESR